MAKFTDTINIRIKAGNGGAGAVSFRREKYIPHGGPDGGDGGSGGDVYLTGSRSYYNLAHLFKDRLYKATNGVYGQGRNKHGSDGEDLVIKLPLGTEVRNAVTDELICDILNEEDLFKVAEGGMGGLGNTNFKTSTNQTPRYAQPGIETEVIELKLNLKLIADVGLIGLPNAGKSTLLSIITNAHPKIADYPFTTLIPNLGVLFNDDGSHYKIADIPGIIEGAHLGHGLGLSFLQHIERVRALLFLIDINEEDPLYIMNLLRSELSTYNETLNQKPYYVVLTKSDLADEEKINGQIALFPENERIVVISSVEKNNIDKLQDAIRLLMQETEIVT